jgi:hypothetical protein
MSVLKARIALREPQGPCGMTNKKSPHPQKTVIPHLMRDLFFMNAVTEMPSMLLFE